MARVMSHSDDRSLAEWIYFIQLEWGLKPDQVSDLLKIPYSRIQQSRSSVATVPPGLENAVPLVGIYKKLRLRYPTTEEQLKWLFTSHPDFGDTPPIDVAVSSTENLFWLSYYLESSPTSPPK